MGWKPHVHWWSGCQKQKCIDEEVKETKSASMNHHPKVHRWTIIQNYIDEPSSKTTSMNHPPKLHRWTSGINQKYIDAKISVSKMRPVSTSRRLRNQWSSVRSLLKDLAIPPNCWSQIHLALPKSFKWPKLWTRPRAGEAGSSANLRLSKGSFFKTEIIQGSYF